MVARLGCQESDYIYSQEAEGVSAAQPAPLYLVGDPYGLCHHVQEWPALLYGASHSRAHQDDKQDQPDSLHIDLSALLNPKVLSNIFRFQLY